MFELHAYPETFPLEPVHAPVVNVLSVPYPEL